MKTTTYFLLLFIFINSTVMKAQSFDWGGKFGGVGEDVVLGMHIEPDGDIYTTGYYTATADFSVGPATYNLTSDGQYDIFIQKTDTDGNFLWAKGFGGSDFDLGSAITSDANGNVYITGNYAGTVDFTPGPGSTFTSSGMQDMFVLKLNSDGAFVWAKSIGGVGYEQAIDMEISPNGNIILLGHFSMPVDFDPSAQDYTLTSSGVNDTFLLQLDADGNFVSANKYGGSSTDIAMDMEINDFGDIYITGYFEGTSDLNPHDLDENNFTAEGTGFAGYVLHLNNAGVYVDAGITHGGNVYNRNLELDQNGFVYVTGYFNGTVNFNHDASGSGDFTYSSPNFHNGFVMKLNPFGGVEWAKHIAGDNTIYVYEIAVGNGRVYTSGFFVGTADFDPSSEVFSLTQESSGNVTDAFLNVLDVDGNFVDAYQFGGANYLDNNTLGMDSANNLYLSAHFENTVDLNPMPGTTQIVSSLGYRDDYIIKMNAENAGIKDVAQQNFTIYPVPSSKNIHLNSKTSLAGETYTIFDTVGRKVQSGIIYANKPISIVQLDAGIYILTLPHTGSIKFVKK